MARSLVDLGIVPIYDTKRQRVCFSSIPTFKPDFRLTGDIYKIHFIVIVALNKPKIMKYSILYVKDI